MTMENPTTEEKPAPSLSEQFQAQRRGKLEQQDEKIRSDMKGLFNSHKSGSERMKSVIDYLELFSGLLSKEDSEYLFSSVEEAKNINDESEFVEKMAPVAKYFLSLRDENLEKFEIVERKKYYREHPDYIELNQLFAYQLKGDHIDIHVPPNEATSIQDKLKLLNEGLEKLAEIVRDNPEVERIFGRSWIVGENPKLVERLGFDVSDIEMSPENKRVGTATMSRERLLEKYLK